MTLLVLSKEDDPRLPRFMELRERWEHQDEAAVIDDREWFKNRPKRLTRVRSRKHMEAAGQPPSSHMFVVRLKKVQGARMRLPVDAKTAQWLMTLSKRERDRVGVEQVKELLREIA